MTVKAGAVRLCGVVLVLLLVAFSASAQGTLPSATSSHVIVFTGDNWGSVVKTDSAKLEEALITDIDSQLERKYAVSATTSVTSLSASKDSLEVHVVVVQSVLSAAITPNLQNLWGPEEVNSLISQSKFTNTLALYPGPGKAALLSAYVPEEGKQLMSCEGICKGMIVMAIVVGAIMIIIFLVVVIYVCCKYPSKKKSDFSVL